MNVFIKSTALKNVQTAIWISTFYQMVHLCLILVNPSFEDRTLKLCLSEFNMDVIFNTFFQRRLKLLDTNISTLNLEQPTINFYSLFAFYLNIFAYLIHRRGSYFLKLPTWYQVVSERYLDGNSELQLPKYP